MTDQKVMKVYYLYQNLPKKTLRGLKAFSDTVEEAVYKSSKVHGTFWINQKFRGVEILLNHCGTYMAQVE